jgi:hypothetical protein
VIDPDGIKRIAHEEIAGRTKSDPQQHLRTERDVKGKNPTPDRVLGIATAKLL